MRAKSTLLPNEPWADLVREICGTDLPRRTSNHAASRRLAGEWTGPGFTFIGPKGTVTAALTGKGRVYLEWGPEGEEQTACFEIRWERIA